MKTTIQKQEYTTPSIEIVLLDNEISLQLQSIPPVGPTEGAQLSPVYLKNDPFKTNMA